MESKQPYGYFFVRKRRTAISLALSAIVLLSITSITTMLFVNNGNNIALAQSGQSQQQNQLPSSTSSSSSQQPKTHEYTLIAENTTLEIAPGLRVDAWAYNEKNG